MRRTALVTGDLGFVGRHMVPALQNRDYDVVGLDIKRGLHEDVRRFFAASEERYDLVVHLAAVVGGRRTIEGEPMAVATDLAIDADLFQWVLKTRPGAVVYYSSSAAYPVSLQCEPYRLREDDIDLDDIRSPDLTYGWAKLVGEYQARLVRAEGIPVYVFRPFSGYGADQDLDYPFPSFIARARKREDPFSIWGPGTQVRDFIHIRDVVGATLAALWVGEQGPVNLGLGIGRSFDELARLVTREAGYSPAFHHLEDRPVGVFYRVADATKMRQFYAPKWDLRVGIRRALDG